MKAILKKVLTFTLVVALTAGVAIGGTVAYLTKDAGTKVNTFKVSDLDIVLTEETGVVTNGGGSVTEVEDTAGNVIGAEYEGLVPGDEIIKKVSVANTGMEDAYVRVTVTMNNANAINAAIDEVYENEPYNYSAEAVQAMYDYIFEDWGINYNPRPGMEGVNDARGVIDGTYGLPEYVLKVDFAKTTDYDNDTIMFGINNWYKSELEEKANGYSTHPAKDGYYTSQLIDANDPATVEDERDYNIIYTYYIELPAGEDTVLFQGLNIPEEFDADQLAMFDGLKIDIQAEAIQASNFATAKDAFDALKNGAETVVKQVATNEELKEALAAEEETIVISLSDDVTYDVAAWAANGMGSSVTEEVVIIGNGNTITFNQTNSDWNNVVTNNDATLTIKNANITNAGHNDGPWNRHDINFACDVVLSDVTSDKALAFKAGASLKNVTIDDANTSDTYAIWIQPNGQSVTLDGCTIDMLDCTDGRGIKIDEQYVDAPEKVTLIVEDTTFKTEEKAAILVKSVAGADITLDNVNIAAVAADPVHAVWVDEASADYAELVMVTGGEKVVEGGVKAATVSTTADLKTAISNGANAIFVSNEDSTLDLSAALGAGGADITVNGGNVTTTNTNYTGIQHSGVVTYNDVTFNGATFLYGEKVVFNDCVLNLTSNYLWTYGAKKVEFNNCIFNTDGKAILVYAEGSVDGQVVDISDCTFNATKTAQTGAGDDCAAVEIDSSLITGNYIINFTGNNIVDSDFAGLYRIKNVGATNVIIND